MATTAIREQNELKSLNWEVPEYTVESYQEKMSALKARLEAESA